jgi:hypothetical protein
MKTISTLLTSLLISIGTFAQSEIIFQNPALLSGQANQPGAVYRFSNVSSGVDAQIKVLRFSRPDIVMNSIDMTNAGWNKAFQPEFGLPGTVPANQNWWVDFEMSFYNAGTSTLREMDSVVLTAIDVDGDGQSLREYVVYDRPATVTYSTSSLLSSTLTGVIGNLHQCGQCTISLGLLQCNDCDGDGLTNSGSGNGNVCDECEGSGRVHATCGHPYRGCVGTKSLAPVTNFTNIDTAGTLVMTTYRFFDRHTIRFTYGAQTGNNSTTAGIRMNSIWFRSFSLGAMSTLPVKFASFTAILKDNMRAELRWTTSSEINVSHFVVERSTDGQNFSEAAIVFANGAPGTETSYAYPDNISSINARVIHYRIRSVDNDAKTEYSATRIVRPGTEATSDVMISTFPNPATSELRVTIPASWQGKALTYEVVSMLGNTVQRKEVKTASQVEALNIASLNPGAYIVRVSGETGTSKQKIIKQ